MGSVLATLTVAAAPAVAAFPALLAVPAITAPADAAVSAVPTAPAPSAVPADLAVPGISAPADAAVSAIPTVPAVPARPTRSVRPIGSAAHRSPGAIRVAPIAAPPTEAPPTEPPPTEARPALAPPAAAPPAAAPPTEAPPTEAPPTEARQALAPPAGAGVPAPGAGYSWPLLPVPRVLTPFRAPAHPYGPGHRGVDLEGAAGQPVLAARAGTVVFAGPVAGRQVVSIQHDDGLRTTYEPVNPAVVAGTVVAAGAVLGALEPGHPACPAAVCLHWGVRRDRTDYLDPLVLLRPPLVRLLPVPDPWPGHG